MECKLSVLLRFTIVFDGKLLRYKLITTGGQSGSPLIATQQDANGDQFSVVSACMSRETTQVMGCPA